MIFEDRQDAGKLLAQALRKYEGADTVVLALPRGGIMLGAEVSKALKAPLGLVIVRKIGHPANSEYAIGAIAESEAPIFNQEELLGIEPKWLENATESARQLIKQRHALYYGEDVVPPAVKDKTVILVDDGIATGLTMEAAVHSMQDRHPKRIIVAVPVAPRDSVEKLAAATDAVVVLDNPDNFQGAVGNHYREFDQVEDDTVRTLLREQANAPSVAVI